MNRPRPSFFKLSRFNNSLTHVAQLGDGVIIIEGNSNEIGTNGQGIFLWDNWSDSPKRVADLSVKRLYSHSVKITSRWFPSCYGNTSQVLQ